MYVDCMCNVHLSLLRTTATSPATTTYCCYYYLLLLLLLLLTAATTSTVTTTTSTTANFPTPTATVTTISTTTMSLKFVGSVPDGVTGIFHRHNFSGRTMALGSTQSLREMCTRNISLGWGGGGA